MKKGFASTIAAVLAAFAIAFAISAALSSASLQHASLVSTQARLVAAGFSDAKPFFDASVTDALLDSAYQNCGCGNSNASGVNATVWRLVPQYLGNSSRSLSYGAFFVNYSSISLPSLTVSSCNTSATGTFSYTLSANSSNVKISSSISVSKTLGIQKNTSAVWINISNSTTLVANVTITCS